MVMAGNGPICASSLACRPSNLCSWHWEVTEATTGSNVFGLKDPQLLMLAPGVQLRTDTEAEFAAEVRTVGVFDGVIRGRIWTGPY